MLVFEVHFGTMASTKPSVHEAVADNLVQGRLLDNRKRHGARRAVFTRGNNQANRGCNSRRRLLRELEFFLRALAESNVLPSRNTPHATLRSAREGLPTMRCVKH